MENGTIRVASSLINYSQGHPTFAVFQDYRSKELILLHMESETRYPLENMALHNIVFKGENLVISLLPGNIHSAVA